MKKYFVYEVIEKEMAEDLEDEYTYISALYNDDYITKNDVFDALLVDTYVQANSILSIVEKQIPCRTYGIGTISLDYNVIE